MSTDFIGVRIDGGPQPFQIVQQNSAGVGTFRLSGRWKHTEKVEAVQIRFVRETDGTTARNWKSFPAQTDGTWQAIIDDVPVGGLYRIESRLHVASSSPAPEWSPHGDFIHHVGVGDLWIIAGQSNAAGYGRGPVYDPPRLGVHVFKNNETWDIATHILNESTGSTHPNIEAANPGHSPYLAFAKELHDVLGYPIGLIQTALGGSGLNQWNPVENPTDARLWNNLLHCLNLSGNSAVGMVWYQGESDANPEQGMTYEKRFADFVGALRRHLGNDKLGVIVAQLNRYRRAGNDPNLHRGWSIVREAQRNVHKLGYAGVVPTTDLGLSDDIHTGSDSNVTLGKRKASAALEIVYGIKRAAWRGANVASVQFGADRKTIVLSFVDVANRLNSIGPVEGDFMIEDEQGMIEIASGSFPARDQIALELKRPAGHEARIHGNYGADPGGRVRDSEENLPMLGFYGLPIQHNSDKS